MVGCYAVCSRKRGRDWRSGYCHFPPNSKIFIHTSNMAAASSDFTQCFSNLKLGSSGEETERSERFWNASTVELKFGVERMWLDAVWKCHNKPNLGMRNLDAILEERASYKLEMVGPLIDGYLTEIGKGMFAKLGRSRNTGLMPPIKLFVPYSIFRHVCNIVVGYGGSLSFIKKNRMLLEITNSDNAGKVFSPVRCKGDNLLRKRHFDKVRENGRNIYKYSGRAAVVVTSTTPIIFYYNTKQEKLTILFYVQRYDKDDFSLDATLQALLNSNHVE